MKLSLALVLLFIGINCLGQESPTTTTTVTTTSTTVGKVEKPKYVGKKDELKIDPTYLIFAGALNLTYERIINSESGVGVTLLLASEKELNTTFSLTPYYRFYFGKKPAAGFFFEGFGSINSFKYDKTTFVQVNSGNYFYTDVLTERKSTTDFAVGLGLGGKWITNNGIIFELSGGIGRNLLNDYSSSNTDGFKESNKIVGRGGLSVGYRF